MSENLVNSRETLIPISLDIKNLREHRQVETNLSLCKLLKEENFSTPELYKLCNKKALERLLNFTSRQTGNNFTLKDFHNKCRDDNIYLHSIVQGISINSARQGSKDETTVLNACNHITSKYGVIIEQLPNDSIRAHKYSKKLITKEEYNKGEGNYKKNDCLKSFDAKISGKKDGYIFAKVVLGSGGHQDNVFEEAHNFGDWANQYGEKEKLYIILIDTDQEKQYNELKTKFKDVLIVHVVNHIELQNLLIK